jgi:pimeloyl-ACP methyl ester carboxylesterase
MVGGGKTRRFARSSPRASCPVARRADALVQRPAEEYASPENAIRIRLASENIDVVDLLPRVRVPTLVLHCRDDAAQPFEEGRRLAAGIRGAHFVALEGRNHLMLENDD